jgi:hypothetical protein
MTSLKPRLVLVEDDAGRIDAFASWIDPREFVLVVARSGGQAIGMFGKGSTQAIAGLMLDHDLSDSPFTDVDRTLSMTDVMPLIPRHVRRTVPILIHSHNVTKPVAMQRMLSAAGFSVTRARFALIVQDRSLFVRWLQDVRDCWETDYG